MRRGGRSPTGRESVTRDGNEDEEEGRDQKHGVARRGGDGLITRSLILCLMAVVLVIWRESLSFDLATALCAFPEAEHSGALRVAMIADPQIIYRRSYKYTLESPAVVYRCIAFITDLHLRKAYRRLLSVHGPEVVAFLGDLHDGGKKIEDETPEWKEMMDRWNWIFTNVTASSPDPNVTLIYACG